MSGTKVAAAPTAPSVAVAIKRKSRRVPVGAWPAVALDAVLAIIGPFCNPSVPGSLCRDPQGLVNQPVAGNGKLRMAVIAPPITHYRGLPSCAIERSGNARPHAKMRGRAAD